MKKIFLAIIFFLIGFNLLSQNESLNRCPYKGEPLTSNRISKEAQDFTITTTDKITRNLYNTLDSGKTVFVDLFYTTCSWCQYYAPIIEEVYQNHGAGTGDIEFWGISNNLFDPDSIIDEYRLAHNITNPCAGPNGGGTTAHTRVIEGQNFLGWPTYVVICPDRTMYFDPVYPPTVTGFDPYFTTCAATIGINEEIMNSKFEIVSVYPNPANNIVTLEIRLKSTGSATIHIYNLLGEKVLDQPIEISQPDQTISLPVDGLREGAYFIRLLQNDQLIDSRKLLISRR